MYALRKIILKKPKANLRQAQSMGVWKNESSREDRVHYGEPRGTVALEGGGTGVFLDDPGPAGPALFKTRGVGSQGPKDTLRAAGSSSPEARAAASRRRFCRTTASAFADGAPPPPVQC